MRLYFPVNHGAASGSFLKKSSSSLATFSRPEADGCNAVAGEVFAKPN